MLENRLVDETRYSRCSKLWQTVMYVASVVGGSLFWEMLGSCRSSQLGADVGVSKVDWALIVGVCELARHWRR